MRMTHRLPIALAVACLVGAAISGCVVAPAGYYGYNDGYYQDDYYGPAVAVAPPAPRYEVVGVAPGPGYLWIGGYWGWRGGNHYWVDGRWERGRAGYRYEPHMWRRDGQQWHESQGRWRPNK